MHIFNNIFYIILFLGFALPNNSSFYISLIGAEIQIREIAFAIIPFINLFCNSNKRIKISDKKIQYLIILFITTVLITEILKHMYYGGGLGSVFNTIRIGLPLFSSLVILYFGIRANIEKVWQTLLLAISASAILSIISPFVNLPIYQYLYSDNNTQIFTGRFGNSNASFGIIGIYLIYRDKERWFNVGYLVTTTTYLSIISLILTFNRTYLALIVISIVYLSFSELTLKKFFNYVSLPIIAFIFIYISYTTFDVVERQVDRRILSIIYGQDDLVENIYHNNRDQIYFGVSDTIKEGHWMIGLPIDIPIFYWYRSSGIQPMSTTDTSIINILLRYGVTPLIILVIIFVKLYIRATPGIYRFSFIIYLLASLNIDSLMRHNSILFLIILFFLVKYERI
jgi:hypothetical protein